MTPAEHDSEELSPAEMRLSQHLVVLNDNPPRPAPVLTEIILRAARWQRAVRLPLSAIGALAATVGDGLRLLLGPRRGRS